MIDYQFPVTVGDIIANERQLLSSVEDGTLMAGPDSVRFLVIHCSATRSDRSYPVERLLRDHRARGFRTVGYHFYLRRDGTLTQHRRLLEVGRTPVPTTGAPSASATRAVSTLRAVPPTRVPRCSASGSASCCPCCGSCFPRPVWWAIATCRAPRPRPAPASMWGRRWRTGGCKMLG